MLVPAALSLARAGSPQVFGVPVVVAVPTAAAAVATSAPRLIGLSATRTNTAQGGVDGEAVSPANSGGASGDPFNTVTVTATAGQVVYDTSHTTTAILVDLGGAGDGDATVGWAMPLGYRSGGRIELYLTAYPTASPYYYQLRPVTVVMEWATVQLVISSVGQLILFTEAGAVAVSGSLQVPLNTWFRIEWDVRTRNYGEPPPSPGGTVLGSFQVCLYPSRTDTTPSLALADPAWVNYGLTLSDIRFGQIGDGEVSTVAYVMDNLNANSVGLPGPYIPPAAFDGQVPSAHSRAGAAPPVLGGVPYHTAVPSSRLAARVGVPAVLWVPRPPMVVVVPSAGSRVSTAAPSLFTIAVRAPLAGVVVPVGAPQFWVTPYLTDPAPSGLLVQVQVADEPLFTAPAATMTTEPTDTSGRVSTTLVCDPPLPSGVWFWRARLYDGQRWSGWSTEVAFVVDLTAGRIAQAGSWTVSTGAARAAHLWFVHPPDGRPGDTVTCYGLGLTTATMASVAGLPTILAATRVVPAGANAYTGARSIDAVDGVADPEHNEIDLVVPTVDSPGGPLFLTGP